MLCQLGGRQEGAQGPVASSSGTRLGCRGTAGNMRALLLLLVALLCANAAAAGEPCRPAMPPIALSQASGLHSGNLQKAGPVYRGVVGARNTAVLGPNNSRL